MLPPRAFAPVARPAAALLVLCAALASLGCSSSQLKRTWRDPAYGGPPLTKVLMMTVVSDPTVRRDSEDQFSQKLAAHGAQGVQSYTLLPQDTPPSVDQVKQAAKQAGASAVLTMRLVGRRQETQVYSDPSGPAGAYPTFSGYYGSVWAPAAYNAQVYQYEVLTIEAKFFDAATEKLLWSGTIETSDPRDFSKESARRAKIVTDALAKARLI